MFFATIHRGNRREYKDFLRNVLECHSRTTKWPMVTIKPTNDMFKEIQKTPGEFWIISEDFRHLSRELSLKTFQETHEKKPLDRLVVNQTLGSLNVEGEVRMPISGDHLSLCKFKRDQEPGTGFDFVARRIGEMISESPWQKQLIENRLKAVDMLCSDTLCQSMMSNTLADGTGEWIFDRPQFKEWLNRQSPNSGLWITGEPGCGKSYIAKHVVDRLREENESVICIFLREPKPTNIDLQHLMSEILRQALEIEPRLRLQQQSPQEARRNMRRLLLNAQNQVLAFGSQWNQESHPTENNLHGLLASTIRQVMVEITPRSIDTYLLPKILESGSPPPSFKLDDLKEIWPQVIADALKKCSITAVVDGFDKMERQDQETFLEVISTFQNQGHVPGTFRLLCFSNDYPALDLDLGRCGFIRYRIDKDKDTGSDIKESVKLRMNILNRIHRYPPEMRDTIEEGVPEAADGKYLQADLMLGSLKRTKYDKSALSELLGAPRQGNAVLYDHILGNLWADSATRRSVRHVLTWIAFQQEGLNPSELGIARALAKARDSIDRGSVDYDEVCDLRDDDTELWVNRFLGHLVKLQNDQFELIHPSLMKYLITQPDQLDKEYGDNIQLPYHAESYMDPAASHALLGNLCATYLARPCFDQSFRSRCKTWSAWQAAVKERMREHQFLRYAALHWSEHLRLAQDLAVPGSSSSRVMAADRERHEKLENYPDSWVEVGCNFHDWHREDYPKLCSASDKILHRSSALKQTAAEEVRQSSATQTDKTRPSMSGRMQSIPQTDQPTPSTEQSTPPIEKSIPRTEQPTLPSNRPILSADQSTSRTESSTPRSKPSTPRTEQPAPPISRVEKKQASHQQQGTAISLKASSRRAHWLVRGAQTVVDKFGLEKPDQP